jgi:FlaA1/EpsC-like NDP-sugar epimerase
MQGKHKHAKHNMTKKSGLDIVDPILALPRPVKRLVVVAVDAALCIATVWLAYFLRLDEWIRLVGDPFWRADWAAGLSVLIAIPLFISHGFYRVIFRYANLVAINMVIRAFVIYWFVYALVITVIGVPGIPRSVGIIQPLLLMVAVGLSRALAHFWLGGAYQTILKRAALPTVLIYGAGIAGRQLAAAMANNQDMKVVGFLDDNRRLHRQVIDGLPVYDPSDLASIVTNNGISNILLAAPSVSRARRNEILSQIREAKVSVRTLPSVSDLAQGKVTISDLRELDIDDLLGREAVVPDPTLMAKHIAGKTVLVTGAGGSIGSELCRQIADVGPTVLLLVEQSEFALYTIHQALERRLQAHKTQLAKEAGQAAENDGDADQSNKPRQASNSKTTVIPLLASIQDAHRMQEIMQTWRPTTVYHAAAYKHVPLVEHNPAEGINNNVFGTLVTAQAAIDAEVSDFVLISTDKAVRPTNIMGATKRSAEMILQALAMEQTAPSKTRFSMVRFGNVLGSSGSVVPKFRQQIRDGGPITLTHDEVTRYFMTIPEAAQLVIQAGAMAQGGEVYVLDMGEPVRIIDLAKRMIALSGLTLKDDDHPDGDIEIQITGLRPGEKLYEELLIGDNPENTPHPRIIKAREATLAWPELNIKLELLKQSLNNRDASAIRDCLKDLVTGYMPETTIFDWGHLERDGADEEMRN